MKIPEGYIEFNHNNQPEIGSFVEFVYSTNKVNNVVGYGQYIYDLERREGIFYESESDVHINSEDVQYWKYKTK